MKKISLLAAVIFMMAFFGTSAKAGMMHGGYGYFYSSLAPDGVWIELNDGLTVWQPTIVSAGWAPYTRGQWIWTSDGWYWDSYEPFGYITDHYGRWYNDNYYGWIWIPDDEWAPAWVEWRYDDDYVGWAPLPPYAIFSVGIGLRFTYDYHNPYNHWHFVQYNHFCDPYVNRYDVAPRYRQRIFEQTKYRTDYGYENGRVVNRGVDVNFVRKRSGQNIRERTIERVNDPREVTRNAGRSTDKIRTFIASKDELNRESKNVTIKRAERNSSLDAAKVEVGRRERGNSVEANGSVPNRTIEQPRTTNRENVRSRNSTETKTPPVEKRQEPGRTNNSPRVNRTEKPGQNSNPEQPRVERRRAAQPEVRQNEPKREVRQNEPKREAPQRVEKRNEPQRQTPQRNVEQRQTRRENPTVRTQERQRTESRPQSNPSRNETRNDRGRR